MHFTSFFTLVLFSMSALALDISLRNAEASCSQKPAPITVCDYNASGDDLCQRQYEAIADFAQIYAIQQNVKLAFDKYIPLTYIQHNPFSQQGRAFAIQFLTSSFAAGNVKNTNLTVFAGEGYGMMHYKMASPNITFAVVDYFRFNGTCLVEHWDVLQQITGQEANPIAFF